MTADFPTATRATGASAWDSDRRPLYRGGTAELYVSGVPLLTEGGANLTTEAVTPVNLTTE